MQLKLSLFWLKVDCFTSKMFYVNLMVSTPENYTKKIHKGEKRIREYHYKILMQQKGRQYRREKQKNNKTEKIKWQQYNHFKCKWVKPKYIKQK